MKKITLNIPDEMLKKIDLYCKAHDFERSELLRTIVRKYLYETSDIVKPKGTPVLDGQVKPSTKPTLPPVALASNISAFPKPGYHFSPLIGKYIKNET